MGRIYDVRSGLGWIALGFLILTLAILFVLSASTFFVNWNEVHSAMGIFVYEQTIVQVTVFILGVIIGTSTIRGLLQDIKLTAQLISQRLKAR